jgi:hypothetical protein
MIERLERTKAVLHQESLATIVADAIALPALLLASCCCCCMSARRGALLLHACARGARARTCQFYFLCCVVHVRACGVRARVSYKYILLFPARCTNESDFGKCSRITTRDAWNL